MRNCRMRSLRRVRIAWIQWNQTEGPCKQCKEMELGEAIQQAKNGTRPTAVRVALDMLKSSKEADVSWVTDLCNVTVKDRPQKKKKQPQPTV